MGLHPDNSKLVVGGGKKECTSDSLSWWSPYTPLSTVTMPPQSFTQHQPGHGEPQTKPSSRERCWHRPERTKDVQHQLGCTWNGHCQQGQTEDGHHTQDSQVQTSGVYKQGGWRPSPSPPPPTCIGDMTWRHVLSKYCHTMPCHVMSRQFVKLQKKVTHDTANPYHPCHCDCHYAYSKRQSMLSNACRDMLCSPPPPTNPHTHTPRDPVLMYSPGPNFRLTRLLSVFPC